MFSHSKIISFRNIMTLPKYLSYWENYCFSFSLKFVLTQFKFIPAEFKYRRDSNSLKFHFHTLTKTDTRMHLQVMFFWYLTLYMNPLTLALYPNYQELNYQHHIPDPLLSPSPAEYYIEPSTRSLLKKPLFYQDAQTTGQVQSLV